MATIVCTHTDEGNIDIRTTARLNEIAPFSLRKIDELFSTIRPRPIDHGCPRNADAETTSCYITVHGKTSDDGVAQAIKAFGHALSAVLPIDDISVVGLAQH